MDEQELSNWLRFLSLEFSASKAKAMLDYFGTPDAIWEAGESELRSVTGVRPVDVEAIRQAAKAEIPIPEAFERGWMRLVTVDSEEYPPALLDLPDPPVALFVRGSLIERDRFGVSIVGTRRASAYGQMIAERLTRDFVEAGLTIISGGASGVDTVAHRSALNTKGRTIAVLGSGLDVPYPAENRPLFDRIAENGAVISEFPPGCQPDAWRFPVRNRLIAALGMAVVIVEAPAASGALITARFADEINRRIFAVPGNIDSLNMKGNHELIKDGGALLIDCAEDVLGMLGVQQAPQRLEVLPDLNPTQEKLLRALSLQPKHLDSLARETQIAVRTVQIEMTTLELMGLARRMPGGSFVRAL